MTTFERIKQISKEKGYSLKQVALKAGLSENAIYRYNQGVEPKYNTLKVIADALHVSVEDLTGDNKKPVPNTIDIKKAIDDDDVIMTFEGRPIPPEDLELMKRLLRGGQSDR
ncbi:MAG TPA: helix-turn-helix domain-containing protein [Candidatus Companilactobacillus pullicola]|jgi:transcriptional regulator with XRE-family HTH domain|uniref:Helix-turn-helix domain-containing protein n=1 Tax=Candidatus Companilactobacillus pullicola TaxID=2838523 RepID=A0A9D1ZKS5_9LACO|nr:helix-turn-helix domain-containing protein [Candidatus Companilactobacillus pullicola]